MYIEKGLIRYSSHGEGHMIALSFNAGNLPPPTLLLCGLPAPYVAPPPPAGQRPPQTTERPCLKTICHDHHRESGSSQRRVLVLITVTLYSSWAPPTTFVWALSGQGSPQGSAEVRTDIIDLTSGQLLCRGEKTRGASTHMLSLIHKSWNWRLIFV